MGVLEELLRDVPLPRMARVRQRFDDSRLEDWERELIRQLRQPEVSGRISPGARVAVAVGSRGIAEIDAVTRVVVAELRKAGAAPFIVPAMGSHGGATAEGQRAVLAKLGIREETVGAPIRSSMDVVRVDTLPNGLPVYADRAAAEADAIVVIDRIGKNISGDGMDPNITGRYPTPYAQGGPRAIAPGFFRSCPVIPSICFPGTSIYFVTPV
ncbi:DUF2088 domain-containing protein [Polycladomyces sp. WAk]|uniref:DUF2088 domain-containing protein n=1 Tax=Polycladomyces zharkentensis TaxID=2807616 RepID=A0ABS2WLF2_9BACL|nr:DUF2088 domain-containing protein [Polycladomyces sp. WAk]